MEPLILSFMGLLVGLSYIKYLISTRCDQTNRNQPTITNNTLEAIPPKYEELNIDSPPPLYTYI